MIVRIAALLLLVATAQAAPVVVDGRTVELPVPAGYCVIDRDRSPDAQAWEAMRALQEPHNRLLAWYAVCAELERWRADPQRWLERHAMVLALADMPPVRSRRAVIEEVAREFEHSRGVMGDDGAAARRLREEVPGLAGGPLQLQLLERTDDGVLTMMLQRFEGPDGPRQVIGVIAFTALNFTRLTANFYAPDSGPEALHPLRDAALAYLGSLAAANPEPRPRFAWLAAAIAAALMAFGGGAFYWLRHRRSA